MNQTDQNPAAVKPEASKTGNRIALLDMTLLAVFVMAVYAGRMTTLTIRGEESRRARIAVEMMESGDWVVPRQQGLPFLSRPPLQNWVIALLGLARGDVDVVAIRLPSVLAVLLTTLLVYGYSRTFLSRAGAMTAALAFATFGQVLEMGRLGETEALFTVLVIGSLILWHWGFSQGWPRIAAWTVAYLLIALAVLAKGPQPPVYFATSVGLYLLVARRWREAWSLPHLLGILVFLLVWGAWQMAFYLRLDLDSVWRIYAGDVALRFADNRVARFFEHLVTYPFELVFGCLLPWSVLLIVMLRRDFRKAAGPMPDQVVFLLCCLLTTFPSCWLVSGAKGRYYMPLYPCVAILAGWVAQRCWEAEASVKWRSMWRHFVSALAIAMAASVPVVLVATGFPRLIPALVQPWPVACLYAAACLILAAIAWRCREGLTERQQLAGAACIAALLGLAHSSLVTNAMVYSSERATQQAVAELKRSLPPGAELVSFGPVHHLFAYYYRDPIRQLPESGMAGGAPPSVEYFCVGNDFSPPGRPPFPFETLAVVSCERNHRPSPRSVVLVGRLDSSMKAASRAGEVK
jgi:4-amino-4-deoxy-L-arabinose transferase-like glycosyltransferase